jgi:hypothetical protein
MKKKTVLSTFIGNQNGRETQNNDEGVGFSFSRVENGILMIMIMAEKVRFFAASIFLMSV